ncbi:hypothetical protein [Thermococcus waiotapuensis]|uniref:Uncharacterized protein n=1 Tax=Thermococcus waiotapuensis TaxID=90909 RepID=A0AAE4NXJ9_9EURY|nr:hypothetical protein [Thermococcus waiotapuensis]MDV3104552.1 hypothetical protein [Thermococcus waiotapuensis]
MGIRCFTTAQKVGHAVLFVLEAALIPVFGLGLILLYYHVLSIRRKQEHCRLLEEQAKLIAEEQKRTAGR